MKRGQSRLAGVIILVVLIAAAACWLTRAGWAGLGSAADPMALKVPVATVSFGDGSRMEIYGLAEDKWVDGVMSRPPGGWHEGESGTETSIYGEKELLKVERFTIEKKAAGVRYSPGEGRLVMSLRYVMPSGTAESPQLMKPGSLVIRLSDGGGLWINGSGPYGASEDPECRGILSFGGWPRGGKELVFQAERKGLPPVEFRLPNPAAGSSPVSWTATPLPQVQTGDLWKVQMVKVREVMIPNRGKGLVGDFEFHSDVPKVGALPPLSGWVDEVLGSRGTRSVRLLDLAYYVDSSLAHPMPPDEESFKFLYRVRYDESYPFPRKGVNFIAKGVISSDRKTIMLDPLDKKLGLESVDLGAVEAAKDSWHPGPQRFALTFKGKWKDAAEKSASESVWGSWKDWMPVVFINGGDRSAGAMRFEGSGLSSRFGGSDEFKWSGSWFGELTPGAKVEIGVMPRRPDEVLEFVVDRASLSPK